MSQMRLVGRSTAVPVRDPAGPTWASRRTGRRVSVRLWLPLTPLFALLAPFVFVAAPLVALHPDGRRAHPWRTAWALGALLLSLSGTEVSVDSAAAQVRIRIL